MPFSSTLKAEQASASMEGTEGVCGREGHLTKAGKTRDRSSCVWRIGRPLGRWCAGLGTENDCWETVLFACVCAMPQTAPAVTEGWAPPNALVSNLQQ